MKTIGNKVTLREGHRSDRTAGTPHCAITKTKELVKDHIYGFP